MSSVSNNESPERGLGSSLNGRAWRLRRIAELFRKLERTLPLDMTDDELREVIRVQEHRRQELTFLCENEEELSTKYSTYRDHILENRELVDDQRRCEIIELAAKKHAIVQRNASEIQKLTTLERQQKRRLWKSSAQLAAILRQKKERDALKKVSQKAMRRELLVRRHQLKVATERDSLREQHADQAAMHEACRLQSEANTKTAIAELEQRVKDRNQRQQQRFNSTRDSLLSQISIIPKRTVEQKETYETVKDAFLKKAIAKDEQLARHQQAVEKKRTGAKLKNLWLSKQNEENRNKLNQLVLSRHDADAVRHQKVSQHLQIIHSRRDDQIQAKQQLALQKANLAGERRDQDKIDRAKHRRDAELRNLGLQRTTEQQRSIPVGKENIDEMT